MKKSQYLSGRLEEVLLSGKWIANTNYKQAIEDVNFAQATEKHHDFNTIALLVFHINYYLEGLLQVFNGGPLDIRDKFSFDMPELHTEEDWQNLKERFEKNATLFVAAVNNMSEDQIDQPFVDEKYGTYERNIEAMIEHSYYHLGQISLLRKLVHPI